MPFLSALLRTAIHSRNGFGNGPEKTGDPVTAAVVPDLDGAVVAPEKSSGWAPVRAAGHAQARRLAEEGRPAGRVRTAA